MRGCCSRRCACVTAGDIVSGKNLPLLDANNGGSGLEIGDTIAKAHSTFSKVADTVVTGHSVNMTMPELQEYATFNREFADAVRAAKKAGQSVEQIAKSWTMPAKYQGYAAAAGSAAALERAGDLRRNQIIPTGIRDWGLGIGLSRDSSCESRLFLFRHDARSTLDSSTLDSGLFDSSTLDSPDFRSSVLPGTYSRAARLRRTARDGRILRSRCDRRARRFRRPSAAC